MIRSNPVYSWIHSLALNRIRARLKPGKLREGGSRALKSWSQWIDKISDPPFGLGPHRISRWGLNWLLRWIFRGWDLRDLHLSVRSTNNEEFRCSQFEAILFHPGSFEKNEKVHLQLHLLYPDNNQFKNGNEKALRPGKPDKSLNSLYP